MPFKIIDKNMIIVAIDEISFNKASSIIDNLDSTKCMVKIGSVAFNSMGHKIPVVVEPYKARKRIVERYECGIVSDNWSDALIKLADDKELRTTLGLNGYKAYKMNYAWELQEEKLLNLYKKL